MNTGWMIYWWTRLDQIQTFFGIVIVLAGVFAIGSAIVYMFHIDDIFSYDKKMRETSLKSLKLSLAIILSACFIGLWIPSSKDMALIVGGQVATNIVQTPEAQELGSKALKLINSELDNRIKKSTAKDK